MASIEVGELSCMVKTS